MFSTRSVASQIHKYSQVGLQVLRGYVGDRGSKPVWAGRVPFDVLGTGYQRPFELATLRLNHMVNILPRCKSSNTFPRTLLRTESGHEEDVYSLDISGWCNLKCKP